MTAVDLLAPIREQAEDLTDLCPEYMSQGIRHLQRNCDLGCYTHDDDDCNQPGRYDGERMANALASIPRLLAALDGATTIPELGDHVNGDPMFINGWNAALEEVQARVVAALQEGEK